MNKRAFTRQLKYTKMKYRVLQVFIDSWVTYKVFKDNQAKINSMIERFESALDKRIMFEDDSDLELTYYGVNEEVFQYMRNWFKKRGWKILWSIHNRNPEEWNLEISLK